MSQNAGALQGHGQCVQAIVDKALIDYHPSLMKQTSTEVCQLVLDRCSCRVQKLDPKQLPAGFDAAALAAAGLMAGPAATTDAAEAAVSFGEPVGESCWGGEHHTSNVSSKHLPMDLPWPVMHLQCQGSCWQPYQLHTRH